MALYDVSTTEKKVSPELVAGSRKTNIYRCNSFAEYEALPAAEKAKYDYVATPDDIADNAGSHNSIYRGKYLGTSVTADQYAEISAGTFKDLFIGDYWTIGGVNYRIAAFDYWLHCGDTECTTHHVVLVPDTNLYTAVMNSSDITTGGYVGSAMHTSNLADAKTTINNAFGSAHILNHRELFTNSVTDDKAGGWNWYDSNIDLMNECMVYGHNAWGSHSGYETGVDKTQLPLFAIAPEHIANGAGWWLRSVASSTYFAHVDSSGGANHNTASSVRGVRPAFAIIG